MITSITRGCLCCFFLFASIALQGQKNIAISDTLASNAEQLKVKMGTQWFGKIWKFSFGEYAVVSSKKGWTTTSTRGNLLNTRTESKSATKFMFVLANKTDSAKVNAAENVATDMFHEVEISPNFSIGSDQLNMMSSNLSAFININNDTSDVWALLLNTVDGQNITANSEGVLSNGQRKILILPARSKDDRSMPAKGYQFYEDGQSIAAVQYYGGGMMGMNKNIVWAPKNLDAKMQLLLAAAMTAILEVKVTSPK